MTTSVSNVQIVANATEFKNGSKGFKVDVTGMDNKLKVSRSFSEPLKAMRYMFMLSKKLELTINKIDLAAVSLAYQKAKNAALEAEGQMAIIADVASNAANEEEKESESDDSDSDKKEAMQIDMFKPESFSPLAKQYQELKEKHPGAMILFRCGDFYETLEDDAEKAAKVLGITLTKNNKTGDKMAGFPHHALDTYLPKLIKAGIRVAICDEKYTPAPAVKRAAAK